MKKLILLLMFCAIKLSAQREMDDQIWVSSSAGIENNGFCAQVDGDVIHKSLLVGVRCKVFGAPSSNTSPESNIEKGLQIGYVFRKENRLICFSAGYSWMEGYRDIKKTESFTFPCIFNLEGSNYNLHHFGTHGIPLECKILYKSHFNDNLYYGMDVVYDFNDINPYASIMLCVATGIVR